MKQPAQGISRPANLHRTANLEPTPAASLSSTSSSERSLRGKAEPFDSSSSRKLSRNTQSIASTFLVSSKRPRPEKKKVPANGGFSIYGTGHDVVTPEAIAVYQAVIEHLFKAPTKNEAQARSPSETGTRSKYPRTSGVAVGSHLPPLKSFLTHVFATTNLSLSTILLSLLYLYRLKANHPACHGLPGSLHRLALASLLVAAKYLHDDAYDNATWASVSLGLYRTSHVNHMEIEFLAYVRFGLSVSNEEWIMFLERISKGFMVPSASFLSIGSRKIGSIGAKGIKRGRSMASEGTSWAENSWLEGVFNAGREVSQVSLRDGCKVCMPDYMRHSKAIHASAVKASLSALGGSSFRERARTAAGGGRRMALPWMRGHVRDENEGNGGNDAEEMGRMKMARSMAQPASSGGLVSSWTSQLAGRPFPAGGTKASRTLRFHRSVRFQARTAELKGQQYATFRF